MDSGVVTMWTNNESVAEEMPRMHYCFPHPVMHEFGHALGLHDLYRFGDYSNYLMGDGENEVPFQSIPGTDLTYLEEIYYRNTPRSLP